LTPICCDGSFRAKESYVLGWPQKEINFKEKKGESRNENGKKRRCLRGQVPTIFRAVLGPGFWGIGGKWRGGPTRGTKDEKKTQTTEEPQDKIAKKKKETEGERRKVGGILE